MYKGILAIGLSVFSVVVQAADNDIDSTIRQLWKQGDYITAKTLLGSQVDKKTKDAQLLALLGQTEALLNNANSAEKLLERAVKLNDSNADYQHWYATVSCDLASSASMFSAMGYAKRCKNAYEKALALAPENPRSYIALGRFYAQAPGVVGGDKERALELARQLKKLDKLQGALLQLNASELLDEVDFNSLLEKETLLAQRPETYLHRGLAFSRAEDHDKAIAMFELALTITATDDAAVSAKAIALYQIGRSAVKGNMAYDKGTAALLQYIKQHPAAENIDWATLRLGQLYMMQNQQEKAEDILKPLWASTLDDELKDELEKLL
jgi:tetratricopeptide (TPR) repeat protein